MRPHAFTPIDFIDMCIRIFLVYFCINSVRKKLAKISFELSDIHFFVDEKSIKQIRFEKLFFTGAHENEKRIEFHIKSFNDTGFPWTFCRMHNNDKQFVSKIFIHFLCLCDAIIFSVSGRLIKYIFTFFCTSGKKNSKKQALHTDRMRFWLENIYFFVECSHVKAIRRIAFKWWKMQIFARAFRRTETLHRFHFFVLFREFNRKKGKYWNVCEKQKAMPGYIETLKQPDIYIHITHTRFWINVKNQNEKEKNTRWRAQRVYRHSFSLIRLMNINFQFKWNRIVKLCFAVYCLLRCCCCSFLVRRLLLDGIRWPKPNVTG